MISRPATMNSVMFSADIEGGLHLLGVIQFMDRFADQMGTFEKLKAESTLRYSKVHPIPILALFIPHAIRLLQCTIKNQEWHLVVEIKELKCFVWMINTGKNSWPELVGADGEAAAATIERQNPRVNAIVILDGTGTTRDFRCDRVWVWVNSDGVVIRTPIIQ
ncbi:hypothetical protein E3N88_33859 [Mikania micrantha]|uniref:Proteinase inhibitor I13 n=1 Tax=Mikania micrantha TaxID=192012 RepID=A0A5N6MF16_9ASTR|nr:hypothetical protein E3N88_33859 [Mikania micrantha]